MQLGKLSLGMNEQKVLVDRFEMQIGSLLLGMNEQKVLVDNLSFLQASNETAVSKLQAQAREAAEAVSRLTLAEAQLGRALELIRSEVVSLSFRLQIALAAAEANPEHLMRWSELEDASKDAKVTDVDSQQVQMAEQVWTIGRAEAVAENSSSYEELSGALRAAKEAGIPEVKLPSTEARISAQIDQKEKISQALRKLRITLAAAKANPEHLTRWTALEDAIKDAKVANVDSQQVQMAEQVWMRGRAEAVAGNSSSYEELSGALRAAKEAGIAEVKLQSIEARISSQIEQKEKFSQAQRKLRIAVSWASAENVAKLRNAISEAKEAGVDEKEITEAALQLSICEREVQDSLAEALRELLREAKPAWGAKDLDAAVDKLKVVGIVSIQSLAAALNIDAPFQSSLNVLLKNGGQRAFTEETVIAVRGVLRRHGLHGDLPTNTS